MSATYCGVLVAPLDLERVDPDRDELRHLGERHQVAGREQVALVQKRLVRAVDDQVVREPAGLGALAPVGRAAAPGLAAEALARVAHAQGAVDERLELDVGGGGDAPEVVERELAAQHHPAHAVGGGERDALGAGDRHLGRAVHRQGGHHGARQPRHAHVLHDDRVGAGVRDRVQGALRLGEFGVEHERVEGDEPRHPARVQGRDGLGQLLEREADLGARAEVVEAEVDRVRTGFDGGAQLGPVPSRGHELRGAGATPCLGGHVRGRPGAPDLVVRRLHRHAA